MSVHFDTSRLKLRPLSERIHDLDISCVRSIEPVADVDRDIRSVAAAIVSAKRRQSPVVLMMGAHVIRAGVQHYIIDLMEKGFITGLAMNGACIIHDFEFAYMGQTTESVSRYIRNGQFGLWEDLGQINRIVSKGAKSKAGLGESIGKAIEEGDFPHKEISIFASGYRLGVSLTVHVGIGYDIVYELPNCDGAAWGSTSYLDFLIFAKVLESLEGGVIMNFGSAVMAPEIFLKALSMARNVAIQEDRGIKRFTTLVCDLRPLPEDYRQEASKNSVEYFFRPYKTMLVRTIEDGGRSYYIQKDHSLTIPMLWTALQMK